VAFQVSKRTLWQLPAAVLALVLNVVLDFILIPRLGILGSGVASVVSQAVALGLGILLARRIGAMPLPLRACGQVGAAAAGMTLMALCTSHLPFIVSALLATLTYVALSVAFRWKVRPLAVMGSQS